MFDRKIERLILERQTELVSILFFKFLVKFTKNVKFDYKSRAQNSDQKNYNCDLKFNLWKKYFVRNKLNLVIYYFRISEKPYFRNQSWN